MDGSLSPPASPGLERSCGPSRGDWVRSGLGAPGIERIEAFFGGHAFDPHRHDSYALGVTLTGVQSFDYRGARRDSVAGNAIVLHPDEVHDGRSGIETGFRYRMLYLEPKLVREALGERARALPFVPAAVSDSPALVEAVAHALDDLARPLALIERDHHLLAIAEAMLAIDPGIARKRGRATALDVSERVRQFLDAHIERNVASSELESVAGLGRFALARHFRASFGTSPYNYLVMRRLDRARSLLRTGDPLAGIAVACGFADQSHLTRQFRKAFGLTPGRWRALQRKV